MSTKLLSEHHQPYRKKLADTWFWMLCGIVVVHILLLLIIGLHSPYTAAVQLLRSSVTSGAVVLLIISSGIEQGIQRWSRLSLAIGMGCSVLFSVLKIHLGASITMPGMRLLWVVMNFFYILGTVLYLQQRLLRAGSTLLVFHGSIMVGIATLIILHSTLPLLIAWPWNPLVAAQLPSLSFDISSLFAFTFLRMLFGKNLSFFLLMSYHGCLILAETILLVIVWANWTEFQGVAAPTYPLYALQSILFAFAIYRDSYNQEPVLVSHRRIRWEEAFIWVVVPGLSFSAFFADSIHRNVPYWLLSALYVSGLFYAVLLLNEHWRVTKNGYLVSLSHLKTTLNLRQPPEDKP